MNNLLLHTIRDCWQTRWISFSLLIHRKQMQHFWQQSEHWSLLAMLSLQPEFNFMTTGYIYMLFKVKITLAIQSWESFLCPPVCSVFCLCFLSHVSLLCSRILKPPWVRRLKNINSYSISFFIFFDYFTVPLDSTNILSFSQLKPFPFIVQLRKTLVLYSKLIKGQGT